MKTHRIALYPGDGIGIDVTDAAVAVLQAVESRIGGFTLAFTRFDWGADYHAKHGNVVPPDFLETLRPFDAIFLGAVGWPATLPDNATLKPLIQIRQSFDLWACVRPARTFAGVVRPLVGSPDIDLVVVRENSEGEYVDNGGRFRVGQPDEFAVQSALHTRRGIERALRFSFNLARKRRGKLTLATKSNAQRFAFTLWDEILEELSATHRDIAVDKQHIDALAMNFIRRPESFDVVVASNLFGDILTDLSGAVVGGLGLSHRRTGEHESGAVIGRSPSGQCEQSIALSSKYSISFQSPTRIGCEDARETSDRAVYPSPHRTASTPGNANTAWFRLKTKTYS